jgi:hypothetical protein
MEIDGKAGNQRMAAIGISEYVVDSKFHVVRIFFVLQNVVQLNLKSICFL